SRRPAALKYTGIYPMLPDPVREFLSSCDYQAKKEVLRVLARLNLAPYYGSKGSPWIYWI
ncbi:MAG: hypothetical protein WAQ10_07845, partial [Dethiobacteria bacterium]